VDALHVSTGAFAVGDAVARLPGTLGAVVSAKTIVTWADAADRLPAASRALAV
jgi:hypothetical protein